MATMNISMPDKMKEWVEEQVQKGRHSNASDFIRDLIRQEQDESDYEAFLERSLAEAVASGREPLDTQVLRAEMAREASKDAA